MTICLRSLRLMAALCAMVALSACSEPITVAGPTAPLAPLDPRFALLDPGAPGLIVICSSGGPASFTVTASPAIGTLLGGGSFTIADGACANAWTATPNDETTAAITVTQTAGAYINIEATAVPPIGLPYMTVNQVTRTVSWYTNFAHGGSATFFQAAPKKVVLCKEGPVGTYAFSVNAVGGDGNVYPSGSSFTIAAGECKDVWTTNAPPLPIDPLVTLTELGTAPLDSIRKVPQDSAAVIVTGSRAVVTQVNYYHGSVVTYFNAFPPPPTCRDPLATNVGGPLPCTYTTPSATCVTIAAVQGIAITPVTLVGTGGSGGPYTFSATGLPAGLSLSTSGTISGTPTVNGTYTYTVTITDNGGHTGTFNCSLTVKAPPPPPEVLGIQGCTPGYWKVGQHSDSWPATGYTQVQLIGSVFIVPSSYALKNKPMGTYTLLAGLSFQGGSTLSGKAEILLRAAIAGILNAGHTNVAYAMTSAQIISSVNSALVSQNATTIIDLATRLDILNNGQGGCPLN